MEIRAGEALSSTNFLLVSQVRSPNAAWTADRSDVNLLSPGVTEKFLELTMEPYRQQIGSQFGKRVPGVFTDEPNIRPADGWPWSEVLAQEFQKRWGYDLLAHLPSLNQAIGDWRKVRFNYFQLLNDQFIDHWSKPYHNYCATNGLQWTGHYWDHDWPRCLNVPDNMAMYGWHQTPAIDCLMNQYEERIDSQFGDVRIVKELSSVANQLGMKRTLCEAYGAGGWDLRFEDMKRIGDWLQVLGVNTINQHLSYLTIRGARKRDHPQSFSYHEPWWDAYHVSARYLARLSAALSQGEQLNSVLLLEPTTTAWMYQGDEPLLKDLGKSFLEVVSCLESNQVEYDLGSEDILKRHGSVVPGKLRVGSRDYGTVIVPPFMDTMNATTIKLLENFLASGGSVLACGPAPVRIDGQESSQGALLLASNLWKPVAVGSLPSMVGAKNFVVRRQHDEGILFHHRRDLPDGQLLFLVNTSQQSPSAGMVESAALAGVERWDPYTGNTEPYPFEKTSTGVRANFKVQASGSLLLFFSKQRLKPLTAKEESVAMIEPLESPSIRRVSENVLTLDYVDFTVAGEARTNAYFYAANQLIWKKHGLPADPWDSAVQFGNELITKKFPPGSGFEASYHFFIEQSIPTNLSIVIERPDLYAITCNGKPVTASPGEWWLDKSFGRVRITDTARMGANTVTIQAAPLTMFHELEPAYVLGDFILNPAEHGFVIYPEKPLSMGGHDGKRSGGWNSQGHPFYGGSVVYSERFAVKKRNGSFFVSLPDWYGSVAQVAVNGKPAGYIDAPPWECDATKWIRSGENTVEVTIVGTLKNTLGPHHGNPPLGSAWPQRFHVGPESGPPPGNNYSTVAYGCFSPFVLKQITAKSQ